MKQETTLGMLTILSMMTCVLAIGERVDIPDPTACLDFGYIAGIDLGLDCCSFVFCDDPVLNKTGFHGRCMGNETHKLVWNQGLLTCDDPKYVPDCDVTTCDFEPVVREECTTPQPTDSSCCVGQDPDEGFFGYSPVFHHTGDDTSSLYKVDGDRFFSSCPNKQTFDMDTCSCKTTYEETPPCDDHSSFLFAVEFDPCCSFLECFPNRTGFDIYRCTVPSVWNDLNKTCDLSGAVPECMGSFCDDVITDPPCNILSDNPASECCRAGNWYQALPNDEDPPHPFQYLIVDGPSATDRSECCPMDMDGFPMWFNNDPDVCCCEPLPE